MPHHQTSLSLICIDVPGSFLNLRETVYANVCQGSAGLTTEQGNGSKKIGQPILKFFALFGSEVEASSGGGQLRQ